MAGTKTPYILAIDQGTTATKALLIDCVPRIVAVRSMTLPQIYPRPGWVEMDPDLLWNSIVSTVSALLQETGTAGDQIRAVGLSNQGETVIAWDRETGRHLYNAISWQCSRTGERCMELKNHVDENLIREKTGLIIDSYLSASKFAWLLDQVPAVRRALDRGTLMMGNLDAWILWKLSNGTCFCTDHTTASRTLLFNVHALSWDRELLDLFQVPEHVLPAPQPPIHGFCRTHPDTLAGVSAPVTASAVDQPAALFGHGCLEKGCLKITYGTGAFLLMHLGSTFVVSDHGLLTSIAISPDRREVCYYLDGGIYSAGALIEWLIHGLGLIGHPAEAAELAGSVGNSGSVFFVPSLVGLAAPHWQRDVQAAFFGMNRATTKAHLVRSVLEAIAFRVREVVTAMEQDAGCDIKAIRVDGGLSRNDLLLQMQADLLDIPLQRQAGSDITGLGIGLAAGLGIGLLDMAHLQPKPGVSFTPSEPSASGATSLDQRFRQWQKAVSLARQFTTEQ